MHKKSSLFSLLLCVVSLSYGQVTLRDSVLTWQHFDYTLDADHRILTWDDAEIVAEEYQALVIENEYIKLTVVPEFGGRIISFVYKPTGHEQLYQNPVGTPYGINENNFYYNWLMVWGGIFPTLTEPEHGKSWLLPWKYEVLYESPDSVILQMALKDTINFSGRPGSFNNGETGITCLATVKVFRGKSAFDLQITLINQEATGKKLEYWTCNTWSPGSEIGNTFSPLSSEMVVPIDHYQARWSPGNWIVSSPIDEKSGLGNDILNYGNLAFLENWKNMGIAYAYPELTADFYGVINHENEEGIFRVGDNSITPGLKFWTWGADAIENDPMDFYDTKRSYIELWSGLSHEFFEDATLPASSSVSWTEHFFPTFDLAGVTYANEAGYAYLTMDDTGVLHGKINTVSPGQSFGYALTVLQAEKEEVFTGTALVADPLTNPAFSISLNEAGFFPGEVDYQLAVTDGGEELLNHTGKLLIPGTLLGAPAVVEPFVINKVGQLAYTLEFTRPEASSIAVYDLQGRVQFTASSPDAVIPFQVTAPGLYVVRVLTGRRADVVKFIAN